MTDLPDAAPTEVPDAAPFVVPALIPDVPIVCIRTKPKTGSLYCPEKNCSVTLTSLREMVQHHIICKTQPSQ
ncbi:MAG: hypothetical protein Harvfovirus34_6 [Harvfovirus sp.]|uniref:Uncharacterized protein n=1 Tax=Harvfovirus sp. TaxID=2487768 RepID=A0A3G5A5D2_9VIRU|nr:MAG: hypothetical protein Harvfovirus34_6 [Harvfovirus sp.]